MKKIIIISIVASLTFIYANSITAIIDSSKLAHTTKRLDNLYKITKLSNLTKEVLSVDKIKNIEHILSLAVKENKISFADQWKYMREFKTLKNGDKILLKCLNAPECKLDNALDIAKKSSLHQEVIYKYPNLNLAQVNHKVGSINEHVMNNYFKSTGWKKIEGEVGRNGIDGLFIKTKGGHVTDVLFVESKYNKSVLQQTKHGQQMTKEWLSHKVDNLIKKYPNNIEYQEIKKYIDKDIYRNKLWNMKVEKDNIIISLKNISDNSKSVKISPITGSHKMKINYQGNQLININNPTNNFHEQLVKWYKESI